MKKVRAVFLGLICVGVANAGQISGPIFAHGEVEWAHRCYAGYQLWGHPDTGELKAILNDTGWYDVALHVSYFQQVYRLDVYALKDEVYVCETDKVPMLKESLK